MSKKLHIFLVVLLMVLCAFTVTAFAEEQITIKYYNSTDVFSTNPSVDSANPAVTIEKGASVTLPTSATGVTVEENHILMWFTADGDAYEAGETVTFTKDTALFRISARKVSTASEFKTYVAAGTGSVYLMNDIISTSGGIGTWTTFIFFNGKTLDVTGGEYGFGGQRTGVHLMGEGTYNYVGGNKKAGSSNAFQLKSHGYNDSGSACRLTIGKDIVVNAPNSHLFIDYEGTGVAKYPYAKIFGTINVYSLGNSKGTINKTPRVDIYEGANVTITGPKIAANPNFDQAWLVTIYGGTFNLPESAKEFDWWSTKLDGKEVANEVVAIHKASFNVKIADGALVLPNVGLKYSVASETYDVVPVACTLDGSNGVHTYKFQEPYLGQEADCENPGIYYYRCNCGEYYVNEVLAFGHSYTAVTIEKLATATESGIKRVDCEVCDDYYTYLYSFDPREQDVTMIVKTEDGTKEVTVSVKDIFDITVEDSLSGFKATIDRFKGIVDPEDDSITYDISKIVKFVIPTGVTNLPAGIIKNATSLEEIVLLDSANVEFASNSIENCTSLKKITLGNCTVIFNTDTIKGTTADLTIDATKANVTTKYEAFKNLTSLKNFLMGSYKTYYLSESSFKNVGIEEFIVPDYADATLEYATFFQSNYLEYVYMGKGITSMCNVFDQCFKLQTVVLMDIVEITGDYFCCLANQGTDVLRVYHHASTLSTGGKFLHQSHGVIFYTNATNWTGSMDKCNATTKTVDGVEVSYPAFTIVKGIPHEYKEGGAQATCTTMGSTGYVTDCPCGVIESKTYTVYKGVSAGTATSNANVSIVTMEKENTTTPALGHDFDITDDTTIVGTAPATCTNNATTTYKCKRCDETKTVEIENSALGHDVEGVEWKITNPATCVAQGLKQKICVSCKGVGVSEVIPATGHQASGEWVILTPGTCVVSATRGQYCLNNCGTVAIRESVEPEGHKPSGEWITVVPATCIKAGEESQYCTVCRVAVETKAIEELGHEFDTSKGATIVAISYSEGFEKVGNKSTKCLRCTETKSENTNPIFIALGYSVGPDGFSIKAGFTVDTKALNDYKEFYPAFKFGMLFVNAGTVSETENFFDGDKLNASASGIAQEISGLKYSQINAKLGGYSAAIADSLNLVIGIYTVDQNGDASVIQYADANNYTTMNKYADMTLNSVSFNEVRVAHGYEALVPPPPATGDDE